MTFNVDMGCAGVSFGTVFVSGPFCGWCGDGFALADGDGDGVWSGTYAFPAGDLEYKYMVDGFASQEDLVGDGACAPITDGASYANRQLAVPKGPVATDDTYGSCDPCPEVCACGGGGTQECVDGECVVKSCSSDGACGSGQCAQGKCTEGTCEQACAAKYGSGAWECQDGAGWCALRECNATGECGAGQECVTSFDNARGPGGSGIQDRLCLADGASPCGGACASSQKCSGAAGTCF